MTADEKVEERLDELLPKRKKKGILSPEEVEELALKFKPAIEKHFEKEIEKNKNELEGLKTELGKKENGLSIIKKKKEIEEDSNTPSYIG